MDNGVTTVLEIPGCCLCILVSPPPQSSLFPLLLSSLWVGRKDLATKKCSAMGKEQDIKCTQFYHTYFFQLM